VAGQPPVDRGAREKPREACVHYHQRVHETPMASKGADHLPTVACVGDLFEPAVSTRLRAADAPTRRAAPAMPAPARRKCAGTRAPEWRARRAADRISHVAKETPAAAEVVATATAALRAEGRAATELVRMARAGAAAARARPAVGRAARRPITPAISMPPPGCAFTAVASPSLAATTERDAPRGAARIIRRASTSARVVGPTRDASGTTSATTAESPAPSRAPER
jgi:hypothetical protein